jgi:Mg-chelatase subunit ChlI
MVELPLSATEDRVVGTLHVEHALRTGQRRFEPGLLAAANRGILYVDEVNLLDDHLVDVLLDAAASGVNVVEREGVSQVHPARFILIGTMNPEEGDLRPQFLDRFGLCVAITGVADPQQRETIVRRRLAFDEDPEHFLPRWDETESSLAERITTARTILPTIGTPDTILELSVRIAAEAEAHGHRAEIVILKAARALAALLEKTEVDQGDILEAAWFVLPHRMPHAGVSAPQTTADRIRGALACALGSATPNGQPTDGEDEADQSLAESIQVPGSAAAGSILFSVEKKKTGPSILTSE